MEDLDTQPQKEYIRREILVKTSLRVGLIATTGVVLGIGTNIMFEKLFPQNIAARANFYATLSFSEVAILAVAHRYQKFFAYSTIFLIGYNLGILNSQGISFNRPEAPLIKSA